MTECGCAPGFGLGDWNMVRGTISGKVMSLVWGQELSALGLSGWICLIGRGQAALRIQILESLGPDSRAGQSAQKGAQVSVLGPETQWSGDKVVGPMRWTRRTHNKDRDVDKVVRESFCQENQWSWQNTQRSQLSKEPAQKPAAGVPDVTQPVTSQ